jgi:multicomponent Na+:H+ antiporter subunit E
VRFLISFIILAVFWLLLGGHGVIDPAFRPHFGFPTFLMAFSVGICAWVAAPLFYPDGRVGAVIAMFLRLALYVPWLLWQVTLSNVDLVYRTLSPDVPISPRVIRFRPELQSEFGQTILANSITLTPGTVTIGIEGGEYVIHAIGKEPAESLLAGDMQRKVQWIEGAPEPGGTA